MLNGDSPKPDIGPKILTPQETWELIAAIVKASLTPPSELKGDYDPVGQRLVSLRNPDLEINTLRSPSRYVIAR